MWKKVCIFSFLLYHIRWPINQIWKSTKTHAIVKSLPKKAIRKTDLSNTIYLNQVKTKYEQYKNKKPHSIVMGPTMSWEWCIEQAKALESFLDVLSPQHPNLCQIEIWKFDQNVNAKMAQYSPLPTLPTMWIIRLPLSYLIEAWQELSLNTDLLSILH